MPIYGENVAVALYGWLAAAWLWARVLNALHTDNFAPPLALPWPLPSPAGEWLKQVLTPLGGKGGGKPTGAQVRLAVGSLLRCKGRR